MELLHMKISDLLLDPHLDFLSFPKHKTGWGVRYPGRGIFTPTIYHRSSVNKKGTLAKFFISQSWLNWNNTTYH